MARPDPLTEGGHLIPANATTIVPPQAESGLVPCFNRVLEHWELVNASSIHTPEGFDGIVFPTYIRGDEVTISEAEMLYAEAQAGSRLAAFIVGKLEL